jgi:hypothetical protein
LLLFSFASNCGGRFEQRYRYCTSGFEIGTELDNQI